RNHPRQFFLQRIQLRALLSQRRDGRLEDLVDLGALVGRQCEVALKLGVTPPGETERLSANRGRQRQKQQAEQHRRSPREPYYRHASKPLKRLLLEGIRRPRYGHLMSDNLLPVSGVRAERVELREDGADQVVGRGRA